jgi:hypothetical protein
MRPSLTFRNPGSQRCCSLAVQISVGHRFIRGCQLQQRLGDTLITRQSGYTLVVFGLPAQLLFVHSRYNDSNGDWWR